MKSPAPWLLAVLTLSACAQQPDAPAVVTPVPPATAPTTFTNPLLPSGPDPWVIRKDSFYYYTHTTGRNVSLWKTRRMSQVGSSTARVVWSPPATGPNSQNLWAPELHFLDGKW